MPYAQVGVHQVVVFRHAHEGGRTHVSVLGPGDRVEQLVRIPPLDAEEVPASVAIEPTDDAYTLANKVGIAVAKALVLRLREAPALPTDADSESWLRRQLEGLGKEGGVKAWWLSVRAGQERGANGPTR